MAEAQADSPRNEWRVDRLTISTFMWACQAMVHHEFYHRWLKLSDPFGWLVLGSGLTHTLAWNSQDFCEVS
jgi:hypothetical protein